MKDFSLRRIHFLIPVIVVGLFVVAVTDLNGQSTGRRRTATPIPAPTATPSEPLIISRADEFPDENSRAIPPDPNEIKPGVGADSASVVTLEELGNRIRNLEATRNVKAVDPDEKQKRLLLNLDILTRAEQRSESLRKQLFEMIEKENSVKTKLDSLEYDLRPEVIERGVALIGTLRPEEIRASRRQNLESEKANLRSLLNEIQRTRTMLEANLLRADTLVDKLRARFEREIDTALDEDSESNKPND